LDSALILQGQEPLYGVSVAEHVPFRHTTGGGRELHFVEEKVVSCLLYLSTLKATLFNSQEVDLMDLVSTPLPKIPMGVSLRAHWLAIDGVQPAIPENPPAQERDRLEKEAADPISKLKTADARDNKLGQIVQSKPSKLKNVETVSALAMMSS
jgi:transcription initiation factor TFIID subunit 6